VWKCLKLSCHSRFQSAFTVCHAVALSKKLPCFEPTKVISLKTKPHAVHACVKRSSQRSFKSIEILVQRDHLSLQIVPSTIIQNILGKHKTGTNSFEFDLHTGPNKIFCYFYCFPNNKMALTCLFWSETDIFISVKIVILKLFWVSLTIFDQEIWILYSNKNLKVRFDLKFEIEFSGRISNYFTSISKFVWA